MLKLKLAIPVICAAALLRAQGARQLQDSFIKVGEDVGPAVVTIAIKRKGTSQQNPFSTESEFDIGSGVIIDGQGHILTNEHVIENGEELQVILSNGKKYRPKIVGRDSRSDLAVLKIAALNLISVRTGDSQKLKIGQWCIALGNPFGISRKAKPTLTVGVISGLNRSLPRRRGGKYYGDMVQTDAAINPGNSGGPLVDIDGKLIGINVLIFSTTGGYQGIGFAIPVNRAMRIAKSLIKNGKVDYGWLGIRVADLTEADVKDGVRGAVVETVIEGSPAHKAGVLKGDLIYEFNERHVRTSTDLIQHVLITPPGEKASVKLMRDGRDTELHIRLEARRE
ncbi:MAG: trypsin-like peptidase domain-containing protein [Planctomycetota bacterium]|nr:trypsin-like peptidase domain-containing protein [Planctomycetota bacterium]